MDRKKLIEQIIELLKKASAADCAVTLEFLRHMLTPRK